MKEFFIKIYQKLKARFFDENLEMRYKLNNLIMICTVAGTTIATILSLFINQSVAATIVMVIADAIVCFCLYLSGWKKKNRLSAVLVILLVDEIMFPLMFVTCGGIHSGMVCWLIIGLSYPFLVLEGTISIVCFLLALVTLGVTYVLEFFGFLPIEPLTGAGYVEDMIQSMGIVALVFGVIFRFESTLYTRQANELRKREEELKESMEKLEQASKAKSAFLANMSHEIRTPINAIMGMNEIILRDCKDQEVVQNSLNIQSASNNLLSIVNDILDFSKIEAGKMEIIPGDYQLSSIIVDLYNLIHMRAFNKGLEFRVVNDPEIPERLYGDEFRIRQVVTNLLTNAVKYTKEGYVELNVSYSMLENGQAEIAFAVKDSGVGISEDDRSKLFQSFQRLDEKHNRTIEGTGLGLTITARLVDQMGGRVTVESELGKGSTFTAYIPQRVTGNEKLGDFKKRFENAQNQTREEYHEELIAEGLKILVVDDVRTNLAVVRGLLKKTKIAVTTALSGKEMLELSEKEKYDIIFLDHMMPEMDGIEALHKLKDLHNVNYDTPVVALTANAIMGAEEMYLQEGFSDYLSKPVHGKDLEDMIRKFLDLSKEEKQ